MKSEMRAGSQSAVQAKEITISGNEPMSWACHSGFLACLGLEIKVLQKLYLEMYHSLLITHMTNLYTTCCCRWKRLPPSIHFPTSGRKKFLGYSGLYLHSARRGQWGMDRAPGDAHAKGTWCSPASPAQLLPPARASTGQVMGLQGTSTCTGNHFGGERP